MRTCAAIQDVRAVLLIGLLSYAPVQVFALESPIASLRHTTWGEREGAPPSGSDLGGFAQTADGYLWIGTQDGLYQFDGIRFVRYVLPDDTESIPTNIWSIMPAQHGGLWIGFTFGGIGLLKDDRFTFYKSELGLPAGSVRALAEDSMGEVWAATTGGLARYSHGKWSVVVSRADYPGNAGAVCAMIVDGDSNVWISDIDNNSIYEMPHGTSKFLQRSEKFSQCVRFAESPRGSLWASDSHTVQKLHVSEHPSERNVSSSSMVIDRAGSLWATASGSVMRIPDSDSHSVGDVVEMASISDRVEVTNGTNTNIREDSEGNIWISSSEGLARYSPTNVTHEMGPAPDAVVQVGLFQPMLVVGSAHKIVASRMMKDWIEPFEYSDGQIIPLPEVRNPTTGYRLRNGDVMIGGSMGLAAYEQNRVSMITLPDSVSSNGVQSIAQERDGALWISVPRVGVFK